MEKFLGILGRPVRDRVTGFGGVATTVGFELYGCVQVIVSPPHDPGKKEGDQSARWFDFDRLEVTGERVMEPKPFVPLPGGDSDKPVR